MLKVEKLIVGNTISSYCEDGLVLDPVASPPYPLRKFRLFDEEYPMIPMILEDCPEGAECIELHDVNELKDGDPLRKACPSFECQTPWPLRWQTFNRLMLVKNLKVKKTRNIVNASIKSLQLEENRIVLRGGRYIEYEELIWTSPYPYLSKLLGYGNKPRSLEATIAIAQTDMKSGVSYHFSPANPFLVIIKVPNTNLTWMLGPGTFDPLSALKHLRKKGYLESYKLLHYNVVNYYALEDTSIDNVRGVRLLGRTAEWREYSLNDLIECNV